MLQKRSCIFLIYLNHAPSLSLAPNLPINQSNSTFCLGLYVRKAWPYMCQKNRLDIKNAVIEMNKKRKFMSNLVERMLCPENPSIKRYIMFFCVFWGDENSISLYSKHASSSSLLTTFNRNKQPPSKVL